MDSASERHSQSYDANPRNSDANPQLHERHSTLGEVLGATAGDEAHNLESQNHVQLTHGSGLQGLATSQEKEKGKDPDLVEWDGPDDPENPRNWTFKKRWISTIVVSSFTFMAYVIFFFLHGVHLN